MYAISATIVCNREGWSGMRQIPTFYLVSSGRGFVDADHACVIARDIINPMSDPDIVVHVGASRI